MKIKKIGDVYAVTFIPSRIEKFFGKTEITKYYKETGSTFLYGGGFVYVNESGAKLTVDSPISIAIDNYRRRFNAESCGIKKEKEKIIDFVNWLRDNYSTHKNPNGGYHSDMAQGCLWPLPKQVWRKDFSNEEYSIEDIFDLYQKQFNLI